MYLKHRGLCKLAFESTTQEKCECALKCMFLSMGIQIEWIIRSSLHNVAMSHIMIKEKANCVVQAVNRFKFCFPTFTYVHKVCYASFTLMAKQLIGCFNIGHLHNRCTETCMIVFNTSGTLKEINLFTFKIVHSGEQEREKKCAESFEMRLI